MKKLFLIFIAINFALNGQCQNNWAPTGAEWFINHQEMFPFQAHGYIHYKVIKDTIIDKHKVKFIKKQEISFNNKIIQDDTLFAFEKDLKVYYYINGKFLMYYDFDVKIGDTISLSIEILKCNSITPIKVVKIDTMRIDSIIFRTIILGYNSLKYNYNQNEKRISYNEKLSIDYYIAPCAYPKNMFVDDFSPPDYLRCYHDSSMFYIYDYWKNRFPNAPCDTLINQKVNAENLYIDKFSIYPNPTNGGVCINSDETIVSLNIYNLQGKELINFKSSNITNLDIRKLINGIYLIVLQNNKGERHFIKVIKVD
jgi:hypothetical protein